MGIPLGLQIGASFLQAGITSAVAKGQASAANQQLRVDMRNERIKGMQDANARQEEYLRNESANRVAASAAVGGGRNISFDQGVSPYNKEVARRDLQTLGYNTDQRIARGKYQIRVNRYNARAESIAAYGTATADSMRATASALESKAAQAAAGGGA